MSALANRWTTTRDGRLHVREGGADKSGTPIVLVHGHIVSARYLVPLAEALAPHARVLAPDLPGFGESEGPRRTLDVRGLANALAAWLDAEGLTRVHAFANSFGCQVLVDLAMREPKRFHRLVLEGPTADPRARDAPSQAARWVWNATKEPLSLARIVALDVRDAGVRRSIGTFRALLKDRMEEKLPKVPHRTLVLRGGEDLIVPRLWAARAAYLLPRGDMVELPGLTHTAHYTAPDQVARVVLDFIEHPYA